MGREGYIVPAELPQPAAKKKIGAVGGSRSWILMDAAGEDTVLDVDKYAIMHRVQIHARDLRILDPLLSYPSTILGREKAIVLNLEVLLRDPLDDNVIPVVEELRRRLPLSNAIREGQADGKEMGGQHDIDAGEEDVSVLASNPQYNDATLENPFTMPLKWGLTVVLWEDCRHMNNFSLKGCIGEASEELQCCRYTSSEVWSTSSCISSRNLDRVRKLKSAMTRLTARVQKVRDELEQLLDDDDDMADLYLSRKLVGASSPVSGSGASNWFPASPTIGSKISRASRASMATVRGDENDVEELEMLLEAYFMQIDGTLNKLTTLREYIDDTEDYINIQLELFLSSATVCLSIYSLVAGIFGMNIPYTWNTGHGYMFKWVVGFSGLFCAILFVLIIAYARYKGLIGS
ncbi:hypothetical protein RHMOL_Rhmol04G0316500 [Rhododendron molle]|uniref:Uncharacterized protein n=1 Tax=Rhododendron molle TaxID=49168 RepID=A0ACC0P7M3_RHOML|nr:hypothetical protein RHMOL_Rhmol04G0316500 [Rhododendron molle]